MPIVLLSLWFELSTTTERSVGEVGDGGGSCVVGGGGGGGGGAGGEKQDQQPGRAMGGLVVHRVDVSVAFIYN